MSYISIAVVVTALVLMFSGIMKPRGSERLARIGLGLVMLFLTMIYYSNFAEQ